jgi:hypothetical protein
MSSVGPAFFLISKNGANVESYLGNRNLHYYQRRIESKTIYHLLKVV